MQNRKIVYSLALLKATVSAQGYIYGNDCGNVTDQECALVPGCTQCAFSYPTNDPLEWSSSEAKCRCKSPEQSQVEATSGLSSYYYGGDCGSLTDQDCGLVSDCSRCQFSYPVGDPAEWSSSNAKCRCSLSDGSGSSTDNSGGSSGSGSGDSITYEYGGDCQTNQDDDCSLIAGCNSCKWSWRADDPDLWNSSDAKCRCQLDGGSGSSNDNSGSSSNSGSVDRYTYQWGGDCLTNQDDDCSNVAGCNRCKWSWRADDPDLWDSSDAKCRCQTDDLVPLQYERDELYFGDDCSTLADQECGDVNCIKCSYSWPKNDPLQWESPEGACRCEVLEGEPLPDESYKPLIADVDGVDTTLYVQWPREWSEAMTDYDKTLSFDYNNRMYLATQQDVDKQAFFTPNMLGGSLEYDVNLSQVGCGCVTALYTILMPAVDNDEDPFAYCDANQVDGHWCPEFDIMEANKYAYRATGHTCDEPNLQGVYSNCDRHGQCSVDIHSNTIENDFMPGSLVGIDTDKEFHVRIEYHKDSAGQFSGYTVTLTQEGDREVVLSSGDCSYLNGMTGDVQKMAFAISSWSTDNLDWLQHGKCQGTCDTANNFSQIKNLVFRTASFEPPQPVDNTVYKYSNECRAAQDQSLCGEDCQYCMMSWPFTDALGSQSPDAACRCLPMQRAAQGYAYSNNQPTSNAGGICNGCDDCRWSWPIDDPLSGGSAEAMFRCKPADETRELSYGPDCPNKYDMLCGADCHQCRESWPTDDPRKWYSDDALCRCKVDQIRETIFSDERCEALDSGLCGTHCRECLMSWEATDTLGAQGPTADCRCKRSW